MNSWSLVMFAATPVAVLSPIRRNEPVDMLFLCWPQCGSLSSGGDVGKLGLCKPLYFRRSFKAPAQPVS